VKKNVLDHGFVLLRNISAQNGTATDRDPANAARLSFDAEDSRTPEQDYKLAEYLMKNLHTSPFEMVECWIEMKLPIFVARQFVRHRTISLNEVSGRYVTLPAEWYIPEVEQIGCKPKNAKQGRGDAVDIELAENFRNSLNLRCKESYESYLYYLNDGVAPEIARMFLHLNHYTRWLWKQDLHNIMHFLSLRDHSHAQWESKQYAIAITDLLSEKLPVTMDLYRKYRRLEE
jgi:thymidylate synthase (FAD)